MVNNGQQYLPEYLSCELNEHRGYIFFLCMPEAAFRTQCGPSPFLMEALSICIGQTKSYRKSDTAIAENPVNFQNKTPCADCVLLDFIDVAT